MPLSTIDQSVIDASPAGTIIDVAAGANINAINIANKDLHFNLLPGSPILVNGTILMETNVAASWKGYGAGPGGGTILKWMGNTTDFMFKLSRSQYCVFEGFGVTAASFDHPLATAFASMSTVTGLVPTQCMWRNIFIDGTDNGGLKYGWRIGVPGSNNGNNNDFHLFEQCTVANYNRSAWNIEQPEAKSQIFRKCVFDGNGIGQYGISTFDGGGSFWCDGIGGGGNIFADFGLGPADDLININNFDLEDSNRLLDTNASASPLPVRFCGGRWAGSGLNADGKVIIYGQRGPLMIENSIFENPNNLDLQFSLEATGRCTGYAAGNNVSSNLQNPYTSTNTANGRWVSPGANNVGNPAPIPLPMQIPVLTVSELSPGFRGTLVHITDSTTQILGAPIRGGGNFNVIGWWDGGGDGTYKVAASAPVIPPLDEQAFMIQNIIAASDKRIKDLQLVGQDLLDERSNCSQLILAVTKPL